MEKNKLSVKWIGIVATAVVALAAVTFFIIVNFTKSNDTYRSIQIYELEGTAAIEREGIGSIAAVENLYLVSGDRIIVDADSYMRLKLDDDKYIMVEENSILSIVAEGTKERSRTSIELEQGAITNEIQSKLGDDSSYDVNTPNSVMAVRGTVFRVEVTYDENNEVYTWVATFEGKVESRLVLPDGTQQEMTVYIEDGKAVIIYMDTDSTEYLSEPQNIEYEELPVQVLNFLHEIAESGTVLTGTTVEKLEELTDNLSGRADEETTEDISEETTQIRSETEMQSEVESDSKNEEGTQETSENGTESESKAATDETDEPKTCTVTFTYQGAVFGTQTIEAGQNASVPRLSPSQSGEWDYDFSKPVTEDVTISWK